MVSSVLDGQSDVSLDNTLRNFMATCTSGREKDKYRGAESYNDFVRSFESTISEVSGGSKVASSNTGNAPLESLTRREKLMVLRERMRSADPGSDGGYKHDLNRYRQELSSTSAVLVEDLIVQANEQEWLAGRAAADHNSAKCTAKAPSSYLRTQDDDSRADAIEEDDLTKNLTITGGTFGLLQLCSSTMSSVSPKVDNFVEHEWDDFQDGYCPSFGLNPADNVQSFSLDPLFDYDNVQLNPRLLPSNIAEK